MGFQISVSASGKRKDAGMTPTTVALTPSSVTALPTTPGSEPKRRRHSEWPRTTTPSRPGASSSSSSARPCAGSTPSSGKRLDETAAQELFLRWEERLVRRELSDVSGGDLARAVELQGVLAKIQDALREVAVS